MSEGDMGFRATPELKAKVMEMVGKEKQYHSMTEFIIAAIEEKLDPELRKERERKTFREMVDELENFEYLVELFSQRFVLK
jgi:Arc/MetJ-type ribon-helix-helix transcriptional regulator